MTQIDRATELAQIAQAGRVIAGLNKQLTEQFELSTKFCAQWQAAEARVKALEGANRDAIALIDEVNERAPSRAFHGIGQGLHAKLCTIRATLARAALSQEPTK